MQPWMRPIALITERWCIDRWWTKVFWCVQTQFFYDCFPAMPGLVQRITVLSLPLSPSSAKVPNHSVMLVKFDQQNGQCCLTRIISLVSNDSFLLNWNIIVHLCEVQTSVHRPQSHMSTNVPTVSNVQNVQRHSHSTYHSHCCIIHGYAHIWCSKQWA